MLNFFTKIFKREAPKTSNTSVKNTYVPRYGGFSLLSSAEGDAMSVATVYRCVDFLSNAVAQLSFDHLEYKPSKGIFESYPDDEMHYLLTVRPMAGMSAYMWKKQIVENILVAGYALIVPEIIGGKLSSLTLINSRASYDMYKREFTINDTATGIHGTYKADDVIFIPNRLVNGRPVSVMDYAYRSVRIGIATSNELLARMQSGGNVQGFVGNDRTPGKGLGQYDTNELNQVAVDINEQLEQGQRIIGLPGTVDFKQFTMTSADMQFIQSAQFNNKDICRFFGIHPSFIFEDSSSNYKSAEMANVAFLSNTLDPLLNKIESEFECKFVLPKRIEKERYRFDRTGVYALDLTAKSAYIKGTIEAGLYTVNDWRQAENRPKVEGGDAVLVSANLKEINSLAQLAPAPSNNNKPTDNGQESNPET